ncbi:MAG: radical SAM protein [Desulfovibrionaceae bacterium]
MEFRYVFGPVLSSRLGRSLGLDLLGARICSMNCVYCESGPLRTLTMTRAPYVPAADLLAELRAWAGQHAGAAPDYVTLGGLGEPCLNSDLPEIVAGARKILPGVPVAVLTNATLLTDPAVRAELMAVDVVLPSMDSLIPEEFQAVNRPHPGLDPAAVARGLLEFRRDFPGRVYLEILLATGYNDSERNLELLANFCRTLRPHRVDVVTLSRPGSVPEARAVDHDTLARWRARLAPLGVGVPEAVPPADAAPNRPAPPPGGTTDPEDLLQAVRASLLRRPQTVAQLACALAAPEAAVALAVAALTDRGAAHALETDAPVGHAAPTPEATFYTARDERRD